MIRTNLTDRDNWLQHRDFKPLFASQQRACGDRSYRFEGTHSSDIRATLHELDRMTDPDLPLDDRMIVGVIDGEYYWCEVNWVVFTREQENWSVEIEIRRTFSYRIYDPSPDAEKTRCHLHEEWGDYGMPVPMVYWD